MLEKFELRSSAFESSSESISSELPHGDSWSETDEAFKNADHKAASTSGGQACDAAGEMGLLAYCSSGSGGHPIWLSGVEPKICGDKMEGC